MARGRKTGATRSGEITLKDEVRDALLNILREEGAPAGARASAGRTLLEFFEADRPASAAPADEMSEAELDSEISRLKPQA